MAPMPAPSAELEAVLARLEAALPRLADDTCAQIYRDLDSYQGVDRTALESSVARNLRISLTALRDGRAPAPGSLTEAAQTARERHVVGVPVEEIIRAFRVSISLIHEHFVDAALSVGVPVGDVITGSRVLWAVGDSFTTRVVTTYHDLEVEAALVNARRRAAAVRAVLAGGTPPDPAVFAIDPQRRYAVIRCIVPDGVSAEKLRSGLERTGSLGDAKAFVVLDEDACLGMVVARPADPAHGVAAGMGDFVPLEEMPRSDRAARLALQLALRLGRTGVQGTAELGWRLAAAARPDVGRQYADRFLAPVEAEGAFGVEMLAALRAWLRNGRSMQRTAEALTVHVNTVRYRLSRYATLTGCDLDDPDDLIGLIWALELGMPDESPA